MPFELVFWHWWSLGAILLIVELLVPGMFFIWMGESAFVVGAVLWLFPGIDFEHQVILFSVLSVLSVAVFRRYLQRRPIESDRPLLNQRTAQYVGRVFTLEEPIVNGRGKIHVDDSTWRVEGEDCPQGTKVRVTDAEGVILRVSSLEREESTSN
ncbi:MAG: NfeD family protein [Methylococcaceae bacterium]|nr:NfeD family protein [Methylococcaceae bacterium]